MDFTDSKGTMIDISKISYKYISCDKLKDAKIVGDIKDVYISGTDFSGCIGDVRKYVDEVIDKDLRYSKLSDVELIGTFRFVKVE